MGFFPDQNLNSVITDKNIRELDLENKKNV